MKTPHNAPLPIHIARHAAAQDAGQFTPWFRLRKETPKPQTPAACPACAGPVGNFGLRGFCSFMCAVGRAVA